MGMVENKLFGTKSSLTWLKHTKFWCSTGFFPVLPAIPTASTPPSTLLTTISLMISSPSWRRWTWSESFLLATPCRGWSDASPLSKGPISLRGSSFLQLLPGKLKTSRIQKKKSWQMGECFFHSFFLSFFIFLFLFSFVNIYLDIRMLGSSFARRKKIIIKKGKAPQGVYFRRLNQDS